MGKDHFLRNIFLFLFLMFLFAIGVRVYFVMTADFWPGRVEHAITFHPEWQTTPFPHKKFLKVREILQKKFSYLDTGAQTFAFVSEDRQYVLKLFKFKHFRLNSWEEMIPEWGALERWKAKKRAKREQKYQMTMKAYQLAYEKNRNNCELVFCHLNPTHNLFPHPIRVVDKLGITWKIPADSLAFVLQKRVEVTDQRMARLAQAQDEKMLVKSIESLLSLYLLEYQEGLADYDPSVMKNTGFDHNTAKRIDVGHMYLEELSKEDYYKYLGLAYVGWKLLDELQRDDKELAKKVRPQVEKFIERQFFVSFSFDQYVPYPFRSLKDVSSVESRPL